MIIKCNDNRIRYTGRWNKGNVAATSTANGSYFEFMYSGEYTIIGFDISFLREPFPHIYINVDGGANIEVSVDRFVRISTENGVHRVCVIMKSSVEFQHRWFAPVEAKVSLMEIEAEDFLEMPDDMRPTIEFIGDSITEGISIDVGYSNYGDTRDMIYWDDATAGYAWITAKELDFRPIFMGYGCLGMTNCGAGGLPVVSESYKYYSDGFPMESQVADYIIINLGTNDSQADKGYLEEKYFEFLEVVRKRNPKSKIISLTPFSGCLSVEIKEAVDRYNIKKNDNVFYIDTTGWIEPEPLHPNRDGHKVVARNLVKCIVKKYISNNDNTIEKVM